MNLGRLDDETTANIGVIKGGLAGNIVPAKVEVEGETRSFSLKKLQSQTEKMDSCLNFGADEAGAKIDIQVERAYEGFDLSPDDKAVKLAAEAIASLGLQPEIVSTGGGSDANVFNKAGVPCVGLSIGAENPHSIEEMIKISDLERSADILVELVKKAAKG